MECTVRREPRNLGAVPWLAQGRGVVLKRSLRDGELARWRRVAGLREPAELGGEVCVPRLHVLRDDATGSEVALTPDGVAQKTLWYLCGAWGPNAFDVGDGWPLERARAFVARLHAAVVGLHERGLVHGDLHLGNVVAVGKQRPLVIDFGHSRLFRDEPESTVPLTGATRTLSVYGTQLHEADAGSWHRVEWAPQPRDDLESVALIGECLLGHLGPGVNDSPAAKRELLRHAPERWGIPVGDVDPRAGEVADALAGDTHADAENMPPVLGATEPAGEFNVVDARADAENRPPPSAASKPTFNGGRGARASVVDHP